MPFHGNKIFIFIYFYNSLNIPKFFQTKLLKTKKYGRFYLFGLSKIHFLYSFEFGIQVLLVTDIKNIIGNSVKFGTSIVCQIKKNEHSVQNSKTDYFNYSREFSWTELEVERIL